MKKFSEQLHKKSQTVKLKAAERRDLRERVVSYMEYHPLPNTATTKKKAAPIASPYVTESFVRVPFANLLKGGAVLATLVLIVIPALAERAVPGDGLYAIKVSFNEEVRSTLALSPYQKIEWETERLNRRIAEARLLASEGRLTDEVEAEVAEAVRTHSDNAKREIEELRGTDEEEATLAAIELNTTLEVQATSLDDRENEIDGDEVQSTKLLATAVKEAAATQPNDSSVVPGYDRLMARVETNTTRVQELLTSLDLDAESSDYQDITRRIADINRTVSGAIAARETSDEEARAMLIDALERTQRLIVFMTEIQASQEFNVEDFVPVVLTPEEQASLMQEFIATTEVEVIRLESLVASTSDDEVAEKLSFGLEELKALQTQLNESGIFAEMSLLYTEITDLARDLTKLKIVTEDVSIDTPVEDPEIEPIIEEATTTPESVATQPDDAQSSQVEDTTTATTTDVAEDVAA